MKKVLLTILLICSCFLSACGKEGNKEQMLNCSIGAEPTSFDVTKYANATDLKVLWNVYEPLVHIYLYAPR